MGVSIKKQISDRLYSESDTSCAFCGFKNIDALTFHHLEQENEKNKDNSYDNLICLCHNCHHMHHDNKENINKAKLIEIKRLLILKTLTIFGVNALKIAYRNDVVGGATFTLNHLVELSLLRQGDTFTSFVSDTGKDTVMQAAFHITEKGKEFYQTWLK